MAIQYSIQKMVSDGTLSTIALGIQYLQRNDIYIRIAGEDTPQSGAPSGYTWSFLDNTTLKILPVIPNGVEVVVYRRTDVDVMYNIYSQNAQFDEATIDENNQQLLYIAQEYLEQGLPGTGVDTIEYVRDDGSFTYYRMRRTDGSYSEEFTVPSASSSIKVLTRESLRRSYAEAGYNLVDGSFEAGGTLVNASDVLLQERTGKAFSGPAGPVAAGTDPASGGFVDRSSSLVSSEKVSTKYGTLNVFMDRMAYAHAVGILTTNTPAQNTAALNAIRAAGGVHLYFPEGSYQFDVFATTGLLGVEGAGKDLVIIELTGAVSPVMVQPGPIRHRGVHFKSVAGSLEWCRIGMADYTVFEKCKVSGFIHTSPAPNAWGCYFKNVKGCRLYQCEFDNNSQSDIPVLEGTSDLIIEGCFSTSGNLVINFEPNSGTPAMSGVVLRNMAINKLFLQNNDLDSRPDNLVRVEGCVINELYYDGLGVSFSESKINTFVNATDRLSRLYGAAINGLKVSARELIPDPMLSNVGHTGSGCPWVLLYSTTAPVNSYNRAPTGEIVLSVNNVASSSLLSTGDLVCEPSTPYLFTICKEVLSGGTRPNIVRVGFKDSAGLLIGAETHLARNMAVGGPDRHQHILVSPAGAAFVELSVYGGDTSTVYQSVAYRYVSMRKIENKRTGVDSSSIGYSLFPARVKLPVTKAQFDGGQYYLAPLPVGTEVEFAYAATAARLARVTVQGADNTAKIGTLQIIANYP